MPVGIPIAVAGVTGGALLASSKIQSNSNTDAADTRARAATEAARIRNQFDEKQLEYLKGESFLTRQQDEINRRANWYEHDATEQNLHNRLRDSFSNIYGATTAQGLNETNRFNVGQGNLYDRWTTERGDTNTKDALQYQQMSDIRAMLGSRPRGSLTFGDNPEFRQSTYTPGPRPTVTDREKREFVPSNVPFRA
jgi:hypothetical protein|tara:strand:- start:2563 stop:3147 length:585 start_codon:yes stop_codon:yes gene_type:complete